MLYAKGTYSYYRIKLFQVLILIYMQGANLCRISNLIKLKDKFIHSIELYKIFDLQSFQQPLASFAQVEAEKTLLWDLQTYHSIVITY